MSSWTLNEVRSILAENKDLQADRDRLAEENKVLKKKLLLGGIWSLPEQEQALKERDRLKAENTALKSRLAATERVVEAARNLFSGWNASGDFKTALDALEEEK